MATHKGKEGSIKAGESVVGELRSFEITTTANEVDTSTMGSDWTGVDSTQLSWKVSITAFFDDEDAGQLELVVGGKVDLEMFPRGDTSGLIRKSGTALITSLGESAAHDGIIERSFEATGDGPLVTDTVT